MKAVVAAFNQEKALVGAFSVITNLRICFGWNFLKHYCRHTTERRLQGDLRVQRDLRRAEEGAGAPGGPQGVPDTAAEPEAGL